jgi:hypothetical protein
MTGADAGRPALLAVLARCGQGEDAATVPDKARASLRQRVLEWLRADLPGWARRLEGGTPQGRADVQSTLHTWRSDLALAGGRATPAGSPRCRPRSAVATAVGRGGGPGGEGPRRETGRPPSQGGHDLAGASVQDLVGIHPTRPENAARDRMQ